MNLHQHVFLYSTQVGELDGEVAQAAAVADVLSLRAAQVELEAEASSGGLWDDPSKAASVMERLGNVKEEIADVEALASKLEDLKLGLELLEMEVRDGPLSVLPISENIRFC